MHVVFSMQGMLYDCNSTLQLQTNELDIDMKYMYSCTSKGSRTKHGIVYFYCYKFEIELFPIIFSKNYLSVLKLEPQNSILDSRKHRV